MAHSIVRAYLSAKERVLNSPHAHEIVWQERPDGPRLTEPEFLGQAAWVILSSGMANTVVSRLFPVVSAAFLHWVSAAAIWKARGLCRKNALRVFGHRGKIDAVLTVAHRTAVCGFQEVRRRALSEGVPYLRTFPFLGPATARHLGKNIGLPECKPDRHLLRVSRMLGYPDVRSLCSSISWVVGDKVQVVDSVIWRYCTLDPAYTLFRHAA